MDATVNPPLYLRYTALLLLVAIGNLTADAVPPDKKFIELGWDIPSTADLREHWRDMEQAAPFDGIMFRVEAEDDQGARLSSESIWDANSWKRDWLKPALADLQACRFERFKDNFVRFNATPGNLAWDDDAGWTAAAEKAGHCAWLMKQGGGKGLAIDFEGGSTANSAAGGDRGGICQTRWAKADCGKKPCRGSRVPLPTRVTRWRQPRLSWRNFASPVS